MKVVAIHQPNFFPWLGYFDKIVRSDAFIFLDHVQFPKKGGVWSNRVKLLAGNEARWVTAPIKRGYSGVVRVDEVVWAEQPWRKRMLHTLKTNYGRAPFFRETFDFFEPLILNPENNLARYNVQAIVSILDHLGIASTEIFQSSAFNLNSSSTELLISLTQSVDGSAYMCGGGADGYQEDPLFLTAGLELIYQDFRHPSYQQNRGKDFIAGLSIIDAFMFSGLVGVRKILSVD